MVDEIIDNSKHRKVSDIKWKTKGAFPFTSPNPYYRIVAMEDKGVALREYSSYRIGDLTGNPEWFHNKGSNAGSNEVKLVRNKAITKLDDQLTVINSLFESWYERREAYALLTGAIKGLVTFTRNWKKPAYWKSLGTQVKRPTSLPEAWLAYGFGIQPLVGLVNDSLNGLAKPLDSHTFKGVATGRSSSKFFYDGGSVWANAQHMTIVGCEVRPKENPNYALLNATGLNQPFSSAWSVIPWGWAVDYFVNVSELLSNIEHKHPNVDFVNYWETTVNRTSWYGHVIPRWYPDEYDTLWSGSGFSMNRKVLSSYPKYNLAFDFPLLGSNQAAYLSSALAITLKGKQK